MKRGTKRASHNSAGLVIPDKSDTSASAGAAVGGKAGWHSAIYTVRDVLRVSRHVLPHQQSPSHSILRANKELHLIMRG